ncbi:MAG: hypothetical protein GX094_08730 [Clostridiales bacterium]|nr:hypothetical protein [Clostridiales bacterium]
MTFINHSIPVTKKISLGGILAAFILICLTAASLLPVNRLFFLAFSSLFISIMIIKTDIFYSILLYATTSSLSFFMLPSKSIAIAYIAFFGLYGIIKLFCEQIKNLVIGWIAKFAAFNICLAAMYLLANAVITQGISSKIPMPILWLAAQALFLIYDLVYTMFIDLYRTRIERFMKNMFR